MQGLMMDYPLTLTHLLERSAKLFGRKEIASKFAGAMHRYTYTDFHGRVHAVAHALESSMGRAYAWPDLDETAAAATCYTSGTTGNPKGVLYTHRAIFLHSYALAMADVFGISESDTILQIVPMFHANGWGIPFAAVMTGARIVFSGRQLQPADIAELIQNERVTFTAGVPTLWMTLYSYLESHPHDLSS